MAKKQARAVIQPSINDKTPRVAERPSGIEGFPVAWRLSALDHAGDWGWGNLDSRDKLAEIIEKLKEFEDKDWNDILRGGSHPIATYKLTAEARRRLAYLQQDDIEELMSLRLSGPNRVWAIRDRNVMKILWWDPDHCVCPAVKKNT